MRLKCVLVMACSLALATAVWAQQPPQSQPPVKAQITVTPPPALYQMNDVSKALNLSPAQVNSLNKVTNQVQAQYQNQYNKLNNLNGTNQFQQTMDLHRQYSTDWNKAAKNIFNDTQWNRYQQLNYQYGGFSTLYDPDVQKRLNLTDAQMKVLQENVEWNNQQLQNINKIGSADPAKGAQLYREYVNQHQQRFNQFLAPGQTKTWGELTGNPYTFQPTFPPSRQ
jgi:hypothetical protein